jgi:hypothetical protein
MQRCECGATIESECTCEFIDDFDDKNKKRGKMNKKVFAKQLLARERELDIANMKAEMKRVEQEIEHWNLEKEIAGIRLERFRIDLAKLEAGL